MTQLVPVAHAGAASSTPPVLRDLAFGAPMPAAPLARAWLQSGGGAHGGANGGAHGRANGGAVRLRAALWAPAIWRGEARGTVLLLPGRTEYIEKYFQVIARLTAMGFAVATLDWRGQGMSTREAPGLLGHIDDFARYQEDLAAFLRWPALVAAPGPQVVLSHSMGGAIALRALTGGLLAPRAAVFSAPFWGMGVPGLAGRVARKMAGGAVAIGLGMRAVPMGKSDAARLTYSVRQDFDGNVLTSDPEHFAWFRAQAEARPDLTLTAPTFAWLDAAYRELEALSHVPAPDLPSLVLLGDDEGVVNPDVIHAWLAKAPDAALTMVAGARHEPLMEPPARNPGKAAWAAIEEFLRARGI